VYEYRRPSLSVCVCVYEYRRPSLSVCVPAHLELHGGDDHVATVPHGLDEVGVCVRQLPACAHWVAAIHMPPIRAI
jgi:hypothetical protein